MVEQDPGDGGGAGAGSGKSDEQQHPWQAIRVSQRQDPRQERKKDALIAVRWPIEVGCDTPRIQVGGHHVRELAIVAFGSLRLQIRVPRPEFRQLDGVTVGTNETGPGENQANRHGDEGRPDYTRRRWTIHSTQTATSVIKPARDSPTPTRNETGWYLQTTVDEPGGTQTARNAASAG
jgi:hypothetical protein